VVLVILSLGLGALLLLNTLLAQGSFTLHTLNDRIGALADKEQALQQRASELASPQRLAHRAQALGMVASQNPAFLTVDGGKILGEPVPAAAPVQPAPVVGSGNATADEPNRSSNDGAGRADSGGASKNPDQAGDGSRKKSGATSNAQDEAAGDRTSGRGGGDGR
jgi:hypothetical protein